MKSNTWQKIYGAKRRAIDRALLAEAERAIAAEAPIDPAVVSDRPKPRRASATSQIDLCARRAIAQAFGRPFD